MRRCDRCGSTMLREHFSDERGAGYAWLCIACGERVELYTMPRGVEHTAKQFRELMGPVRAGRPPKNRAGREQE